MDEDETIITEAAEPEVIAVVVPEPEVIETETEDETEWQQTEPQEELSQINAQIISAQNLLMDCQALQQNLYNQVQVLTEANQNLTTLLQSALPGLQAIATLADATTDKNTRRRLNRTMRGR